MYHCHSRIYLVGFQDRNAEILRTISPLEHFDHIFSATQRPEKALTVQADVIFADIRHGEMDEILPALIADKTEQCELILLAGQEQIALLHDEWQAVRDIWTLPMSEEELRFRFQRWQQTYKMSKDFWETRHYLEATINHTPTLVWYKDKDGVHEKVNDSFCRTVNKTREQVEGQKHAYIWDVEQDDPACIESEREVMSREKTCISEETVKAGDGQKILTTYKSPLYDLDGTVMGTVGVAIDVTQERAYEQEIITKNHTLEMIFTTLDCGVMRHSVDGSQIISINRAALKILGYESQEELMEAGFHTIAPSVMLEDQKKLKRCIEQLTKEGDNVNVEYRVQHPDGEILHVMGNIKLLEENGERFYQRFLLDITTQKLKEKRERQEQEKRQMGLIHALSIDFNLVCFFDLDTGMGAPLRVDDRHGLDSVFFGEISLQESMDLYIQQYIHENDREMMRQASTAEYLRKELAGKKLYYVNYRLMRGEKMKYYQMRVVRAGDWEQSHGVVIGFRSVDEEIRNEMEQKSLLEEALQQANKANQAKSVFLSNMSHDIRTPMNAIVGFTTLAITHIDQREQVEGYLKKIMTSGNHLLNLINDILDMSRIESGKIQLEEQLCSLPGILHGLYNIIQANAHEKQLELSIDTVDIINEDIYCDELRLNQVLLNLLSNAVKYTNEGGSVLLRVTEKPGAPAGYANYEFYIRDTGIGMSEEFVSRVFEPFEREYNSTISRIQGTGLGMAITKNLVTIMNGSIEVQSQQNVGTEVTVSFVFRLDPKEQIQQEIPEFKNHRVLVVGADTDACHTMTDMLQCMGMRADWVLSAEETVIRIRQAVEQDDSYSLCLMDWVLPDTEGLEAVREIREKTGEMAPVMIMAAYDWADLEEEAREAGIAAFCNKPLFLSELRAALQSALDPGVEQDQAETEDIPVMHTGRILLAEDVDLNQEIAEAILTEAGFSVEIANNGQEAVDMLQASKPGYYQLLLMDIQMPVMDGYEATKMIRNLDDHELASIPILAMSANAFEEDRQEALKSGMNGHIAKPIDVSVLFQTLNEILSDKEFS